MAVFLLVAGGAALLEYLGPGAFAAPFSPDLPDGALAVARGTVEEVVEADGGHLVCRVGRVRVFVPASAVPDPPPRLGEALTCYGTVSTYRGERELAVRGAGDIRRLDQA